MMYLTVTFGGRFYGNLTYPITCVRSGAPIFLRQRNQQSVLLDLVADLNSKISHVCGYPFGIETEFKYAIPKLTQSSSDWLCSNLSSVPIEKKKFQPAEEEEEDDDDGDERVQSQPVSLYTQTQNQNNSFSAGQSDEIPRGRHFTDYRKPKTYHCDESPPQFVPYISQRIEVEPLKPVYAPIFTPKYKLPSTMRSETHIPSVKLITTPTYQRTETFTTTERPKVFTPTFKPFPRQMTLNKESDVTKPVASHQEDFGLPTYQSFNNSLGLFYDVAVKKARSKPQVQTDLDIPALARTKDGLNKANTTTLIAYLRSEGVSCKVKDKKMDLVSKVLNHLNLPTCSSSFSNKKYPLDQQR
uniref:DUF4708 domain-containing protein n=2 Tax=Clastoptera arizonana TaxID=38151 RepID=A0A1B6C3T0_9HEMI